VRYTKDLNTEGSPSGNRRSLILFINLAYATSIFLLVLLTKLAEECWKMHTLHLFNPDCMSADSHEMSSSNVMTSFERELARRRKQLQKKSKSVRFEDYLDNSASGYVGGLRRKFRAEDQKSRFKKEVFVTVADALYVINKTRSEWHLCRHWDVHLKIIFILYFYYSSILWLLSFFNCLGSIDREAKTMTWRKLLHFGWSGQCYSVLYALAMVCGAPVWVNSWNDLLILLHCCACNCSCWLRVTTMNCKIMLRHLLLNLKRWTSPQKKR